MTVIKNKSFDEERAFYGCDKIRLEHCRFEGDADGESAFKEGRNIQVENCFFNLRYPFWHCQSIEAETCKLSPLCRAAFWYSEKIDIRKSELSGIKALTECRDIKISDCEIDSEEFGWSNENVQISNTKIISQYFMLRSSKLNFSSTFLKGKYSFQYITDSVFENCSFDTKDAFWHAKNVTVRNSRLTGEYLGWYSENLTFENCVLSGTQPLCYCKGLKLINCTMENCDLAFEKSEVEAQLNAPVISIKNPLSGRITLPFAQEIITDLSSACIIETEGR